MKKGLFWLFVILQTLFLAGCSSNVENDIDTTGGAEVSGTADVQTMESTIETVAATNDEEISETGNTEESAEATMTNVESITEVSVSETTVPTMTESATLPPETAEVTTSEPVLQWERTEVSLNLYVNKDGIYSRKMPIQGYEISRQFKLNDCIHVISKTDTGYYETDNGDFIHQDYLSDKITQLPVTTTTVATQPTVPSNTQPIQSKPIEVEYFDPDAWLPIKIDRNKYAYYTPDSAVDVDDERRPVYSELFKQIPGYVSGEFEFTNVRENTISLKYSHLTKENALKIKELSDHYWDDFVRYGWFSKDYPESYKLSEKRERIYNLIDAEYCAMNSDIGDYAPDGTQYVGKTLDGYCYTAKTELKHLYWIVAPREFKQLPEHTYFKGGFGGGFSEEKKDGFDDVSNYYVIPGRFHTLISDSEYENQWFPVDGSFGGFVPAYPKYAPEYRVE